MPFAAGGGTDLLARLVAEGLSKRLGQSFVTLNRPGGNTNTGTLQVVKSAPDGHTLVMASIGLAANPSLYRKLAFDPLDRSRADHADRQLADRAGGAAGAAGQHAWRSSSRYLKAHPGALNYASYGAGSGPHLATELFRSMTGVDIVHVPYSGGGPAAVGVMGNNVQMLFASVLPVLGLVRGGKLKAHRHRVRRRARRCCRTCRPSRRAASITGPAPGSACWRRPGRRTPSSRRCTGRWPTCCASPRCATRIVEQGAEVVGNTPGEFRAFLKEETERLAVVDPQCEDAARLRGHASWSTRS